MVKSNEERMIYVRSVKKSKFEVGKVRNLFKVNKVKFADFDYYAFKNATVRLRFGNGELGILD